MNNTVSKSKASIESERGDGGDITLKISGRLDVYSTGAAWNEVSSILESENPGRVIADASEISYIDASGIALFLNTELYQKQRGGEYELRGLSDDLKPLFELFSAEDFATKGSGEQVLKGNFVEKIGEKSESFWEEIKVHIIFTGHVTVSLVKALRNPFAIRWGEVLVTSEKFGANALFIIALVNFLVGLVIAFQSAVPMKTYGAEVFVADLLVIAYFKELGPIMTAFVVNGRSGSAFAAELGTMKVNEELDALDTMGLDPVPFLVVPKIIASVLMLPLLTVFGNLFGLIGGWVVMLSLGFTTTTYLNQLTTAANYEMLLAGLFKTLFFAIIIAGVGCLSGMRASKGPSAVGDAATSAVVIGIVLMIVTDGLFGVIYYILGI